MKKSDPAELPEISELKDELKHEKYKQRYIRVLRNTIFTLLIVAAAAILSTTLWLPVLKIFGNSMTPTLQEGQVVVAVKNSRFRQGDIIGFYYGNKLLVKRYIAGPGEWVNIDSEGTVYVNDVELEESYLVEKALGDCDITLPYQVPDGRYFVMGDHRSTSIDSRNTMVGCIADEQVVGKIMFVVWPLSSFGTVK